MHCQSVMTLSIDIFVTCSPNEIVRIFPHTPYLRTARHVGRRILQTTEGPHGDAPPWYRAHVQRNTSQCGSCQFHRYLLCRRPHSFLNCCSSQACCWGNENICVIRGKWITQHAGIRSHQSTIFHWKRVSSRRCQKVLQKLLHVYAHGRYPTSSTKRRSRSPSSIA